MKKEFSIGLCEGRHKLPVNDFLFPQEVNPTNLKALWDIMIEKITALGIEPQDTVNLYVTGLTVALTSFISWSIKNNIELFLYHYDRETGGYIRQYVPTDNWLLFLAEDGHFPLKKRGE